MILHAAVAPIQDCTDAFRVAAELEVSLWLSAIHVYDSRNLAFDSSAFASSDLLPTLQQPSLPSTRPNLTFLRSTVADIDGVEERTALQVEAPIPLAIGFRRLQQHSLSIPKTVGQPIATLGFLSASAQAAGGVSRVRVEAVLTLDLEPFSPTFGIWRAVERWIEGAVDVSNLGETVVIVRLALV